MSNEKKMRELMARLVSMSPEPPPYPEESPVVRHVTNKERRPALVFVGAAALVVLLAVPLLLMTGGDDPVVAGSSTTTSTTLPATVTSADAVTTTSDGVTTTTAGSTTLLDEGGDQVPVVVFRTQSPENSSTGNPTLVPLMAAVDGETPEALAAVNDLLPPGLDNAVPAGVTMVDGSRQTISGDEVIVVDMSANFLDGAGGLLADTTMLNQLIYTLTFARPDLAVLFTVNGEPVEAFGSEGLTLTEPVDRETFRDELAPIFLTDPITEVEHVYVVAGMANTFEAALTVRVIDGTGSIVHEEPVQATCGSGCWGEFGIGLDSDLIEAGESSVQLLTYSAEDGSPTNVITIPIPEGGVWDLSGDN